MERAAESPAKKYAGMLGFIAVWAATGWLLYPLVFVGEVTTQSVKGFFYRSAAGIVIMIILFGKTLFDLLFPQNVSRRKSALSVALLTVYALAMAGGIIFILVRILLLYLNQNTSDYVPS
ncbi:MAG: hypothetical protein FJY80_12320 [Candidatus Aminicenantes bacterium]|nr:hypothetical protein [Candidatus Aminicenantes bacterium]